MALSLCFSRKSDYKTNFSKPLGGGQVAQWSGVNCVVCLVDTPSGDIQTPCFLLSQKNLHCAQEERRIERHLDCIARKRCPNMIKNVTFPAPLWILLAISGRATLTPGEISKASRSKGFAGTLSFWGVFHRKNNFHLPTGPSYINAFISQPPFCGVHQGLLTVSPCPLE